MRTPSRAWLVCLLLAPAYDAAGQSTGDPVGVRAAGMAGAFVSVVDDASAVYWNPGALASGAYFSLVLDRNTQRAIPDGGSPASGQSGLLIAIGTPPLGLSYYRTRQVSAVGVPGQTLTGARVASLVAHHGGVTVVQSLSRSLAIGTTFKLVRGVVAIEDGASGTPSALLDAADRLSGRSTTRLDADVGVKLTGSLVQAGLTVRNLFEPEFSAAGGAAPVRLERQARAGVALTLSPQWRVATDWDLMKADTVEGRRRDAAVGTEGHPGRRVWVRGGFRWNTAGEAQKRPTASIGGSYALLGSLIVDAQAGGGTDGYRGWGMGARFVF